MYVLLERLTLLWARGDADRLPLPETALEAFLEHCSRKIGDDYFRTPRNTIRAFLDLLAILDQNPSSDWRDHLDAVEMRSDRPVEDLDVEDVPVVTLGRGAAGSSRGREDDLAVFDQ